MSASWPISSNVILISNELRHNYVVVVLYKTVWVERWGREVSCCKDFWKSTINASLPVFEDGIGDMLHRRQTAPDLVIVRKNSILSAGVFLWGKQAPHLSHFFFCDYSFFLIPLSLSAPLAPLHLKYLSSSPPLPYCQLIPAFLCSKVAVLGWFYW